MHYEHLRIGLLTISCRIVVYHTRRSVPCVLLRRVYRLLLVNVLFTCVVCHMLLRHVCLRYVINMHIIYDVLCINMNIIIIYFSLHQCIVDVPVQHKNRISYTRYCSAAVPQYYRYQYQ